MENSIHEHDFNSASPPEYKYSTLQRTPTHTNNHRRRQDEAVAPVTTSSFFRLFRLTHTHLHLPRTLLTFPQSDTTEPRYHVLHQNFHFSFVFKGFGGFDFRSHVSHTPPLPVEIYKICLFTKIRWTKIKYETQSIGLNGVFSLEINLASPCRSRWFGDIPQVSTMTWINFHDNHTESRKK